MSRESSRERGQATVAAIIIAAVVITSWGAISIRSVSGLGSRMLLDQCRVPQKIVNVLGYTFAEQSDFGRLIMNGLGIVDWLDGIQVVFWAGFQVPLSIFAV